MNKDYICEVCHESKTASEMSRSYKHRCKECVAKQNREKRATTKELFVPKSDISEIRSILGNWVISFEADGSLRVSNIENSMRFIAFVPVANNAARIYMMKGKTE